MKRTNMKTIDRAIWETSGLLGYSTRMYFESLRETIYRQLLKARKEAYQEGYEDAHNHTQLISKWRSNGDK